MRLHVLAVAHAGALVLGCAQTPDVKVEGGPAARQALAEHAAEGPVLAIVEGSALGLAPAERNSLVTEAMARGVSGLGVRFTSDRARAKVQDPYLVVLLNPASAGPASLACRQPEAAGAATAEGRLRVLATFCRDGEAIGVARAETEGPLAGRRQLERLLWSTTAQLFPDDYAESYGFDVLPGWIDLRLGGDFGF